MTTKQIAEAVGKPEQTVRNWVRSLASKMDSIKSKLDASTSTHPADYNLEETCAIIEKGLGKNAASLYRENAKHQTPATMTTSELDAAFKASLVTLTMMAQNLDTRIAKIESKIEQRQVLLPAPQMDPRNHIAKIVREYVARTGVDHRTAYGVLYTEFGYRTHCNPTVSAKNREMKIIDYIESEGQLEVLEAIALEIMGRHEATA